LSCKGHVVNFDYIYFVIGLIGLLVRAYTIGYTPENTSGRNTRVGQVADQLNTLGIYSTVRHPLYLGNFISWFAIALLTANYWFVCVFILIYWLYYERIAIAEEQFLRRKFGSKYLRWADAVPAFIPNISLFKNPALRFSLKKVLRKEKNGIFAYMLVFAIFTSARQAVTNQPNTYLFLSFAMLSAVGYVLLKYLKYKTTVLTESGR
jgi:hypothetical protein